MEWITANWFNIATILVAVLSLIAHLYPQRTRFFFGQLPRYSKQWAQWRGTKEPVRIGSYQVAAVSPMMVLGWGYQICIGMLMVLTVILAALGSLNVLVTGLPTQRIIWGCFLCAAMLYTLYRIRKMP